jgi:hypothetical protein
MRELQAAVDIEAGAERVWAVLTELLAPGLFDGEHSFRIEPVGPARVRFLHRERFSGMALRGAG